jgi:hypothetical protein
MPSLVVRDSLILAALWLGCNSAPPAADGEAAPVSAKPPSAAGPVPNPDDDTWTEHSSDTCGFAVRLPSFPMRTPPPPGLLDQIAIEDNLRNVAMLAACGDVASVGSTQEFLEVTSQVIAGQLHAKIDETHAIELDGRPGIELSMTIPAADKPVGLPWPGDLSYRLRLYVAGTRQYQVHLLHAATTDIGDDADHFFAGFRLLDSAPAADAELPWTTQTVAGVSVLAPGTMKPLPTGSADFLEGVRFGGEGRSTPYALSLWKAQLPGEFANAVLRLRAHFMLRIATEHTDIISETEVTVDGRTGLDVVYRPNTPLPESIAPKDEATRAALADLIAHEPPQFRLRLLLDGDRIVQALVADADADADRFLESLSFAAP